jgi:hypothetical protein
MPVIIAAESPDQAEVRDLLRLADERSAGLYPHDPRPGPELATLLALRVHFFVARLPPSAPRSVKASPRRMPDG